MFEIKSDGTRGGTEICFNGKPLDCIVGMELVMGTEDRVYTSRVDLIFDDLSVGVHDSRVSFTLGEALKAAGYELVRRQDPTDG